MASSVGLAEEWKSRFVSPVMTGDFWGRLEWREREEQSSVYISCTITIDKDFSLKTLILKGIEGYVLSGFRIEEYDVHSVEAKSSSRDYEEVIFDFKDTLDLLAGKPLVVNYQLDKVSAPSL